MLSFGFMYVLHQRKVRICTKERRSNDPSRKENEEYSKDKKPEVPVIETLLPCMVKETTSKLGGQEIRGSPLAHPIDPLIG